MFPTGAECLQHAEEPPGAAGAIPLAAMTIDVRKPTAAAVFGIHFECDGAGHTGVARVDEEGLAADAGVQVRLQMSSTTVIISAIRSSARCLPADLTARVACLTRRWTTRCRQSMAYACAAQSTPLCCSARRRPGASKSSSFALHEPCIVCRLLPRVGSSGRYRERHGSGAILESDRRVSTESSVWWCPHAHACMQQPAPMRA